MKRMTILGVAALMLVMGLATVSHAKEPGNVFGMKKEMTERYRRGRAPRNRGGVWFNFGNGGYYSPRHYHPPRGYYYAPPPPGYYYGPSYGGSIVIR